MESGIALLRALCEGLSPAIESDALPSSTLRFVLEYSVNPVLEREQARLSMLLDTNSFELKLLFATSCSDIAADVGFGVFVVLQFPGLERTASQKTLLRIGYALQTELQLVSVEPDLGTRVFADPEPPGAVPEGIVKDAFENNCWVNKDEPADVRWVLRNANVLSAWQRAKNQGEDVLIAQPDTGIAEHTTMRTSALRMDLGINLVEGGSAPTDPLSDRTSNPGHGTGTSSVVVACSDPGLMGVSPAASLIPIRCIDDVKVFNPAPVAAAIDHARRVGSHVISLILGGVPSRAMLQAIKRAIREDIIVLAAAGNCVNLVVWPARYNDVIAIGGSNINDEPWQGSSRGAPIDVCAPAELVWRALRLPDNDDTQSIAGGQGTSYATALIAGVAALWLAHHGRSTIVRAAGSAHLSVQVMFRRALTRSARRPDGWNTDKYGAGIVDADALLALPLTELSVDDSQEVATRSADNSWDRLLASQYFTDSAKASADTSSGVASQLRSASASTVDSAEASETRRAPHAVDWRGFELEIAALVLDDARLGVTAHNGQHKPERARVLLDMSSELKAAVQGESSEELKPLWQRQVAAAASLMGPRVRQDRVEPMRQLATSRSRSLESTAAMSPEKARASLTSNVIRDKLDAMEKRFDSSSAHDDTSAIVQLRQQVLEDSEHVLAKMRKGEAIASNDIQANTALEALVKLEGRPAIALTDEAIDLNDPELGAWQGPIALLQHRLQEAQQSVGRIDAEDWHQGTGFVVGDGLVLTNRHVLESFAMPVPHAQNPERWVFEQEPVIHFSPTADDTERCFRVTGVVFGGADPIIDGSGVDFDELDLALLEVETTNAAGQSLPTALPVSTEAAKSRKNSQVFVLGYPAQPQHFPQDEEGKLRLDVVERVRQIFGMRYGVRYLSPGMIATASDGLDLGTRQWSFAHDATSLGGNSGSCVLSCDDELAVIGLHFAGDWMRANYAHEMARLKAASVGIPCLFE